MPRREPRARAFSRGVLVALLLAVATLAAACGGSGPSGPVVPELFVVNTSPDQQRIRAERVADIAAQVPAAVRASGLLVVGTTGDTPPLAFRADDSMTMIGVEPDLAQLVADVLGLELRLETVPWDELFGAVESGRLDIAFGNFTVTADRQRRFDMSTYQQEEQAFVVRAGSAITEVGGPPAIAGLRIGVGAGTTSEKILQDWNRRNAQSGLAPARLVNYTDGGEYYAALDAGQVDAVFGPMSVLNYHAVTTGLVTVVGTVPGAGDRSAEIAAITRRGEGLAQAVTAAVNAVITTGKYQAVLDRWALGHAAITQSRVAAAAS